DLTGVISVADNGGSSGKLREELGVLPPGDLLRAVLALSEYDFGMLKDIFYKTRFTEAGKLSEHNLGNLFITFAAQYSDLLSALKAFGQALRVRGTVLPATLESVDLCAELSNGEIMRGEESIDEPKYNRELRVKRVFLDPAPQALPEAIQAIKEADLLVLGGGDIYTSMVASVLPTGIQAAVAESKAPIAYVSNRYYHANGETVSHKVSEIIVELEKYLPRNIDLILIDPTPITDSERETTEAKKWGIKENDLENISCQIVEGEFDAKFIGINPEALGQTFKKIL
nr:YvcK family protein [Candidatus Magasanikbacteria bacterium]